MVHMMLQSCRTCLMVLFASLCCVPSVTIQKPHWQWARRSQPSTKHARLVAIMDLLNSTTNWTLSSSRTLQVRPYAFISNSHCCTICVCVHACVRSRVSLNVKCYNETAYHTVNTVTCISCSSFEMTVYFLLLENNKNVFSMQGLQAEKYLPIFIECSLKLVFFHVFLPSEREVLLNVNVQENILKVLQSMIKHS